MAMYVRWPSPGTGHCGVWPWPWQHCGLGPDKYQWAGIKHDTLTVGKLVSKEKAGKKVGDKVKKRLKEKDEQEKDRKDRIKKYHSACN